jgi:hypothetical protein
MSNSGPDEEMTRFERGSGNVFADLGLPNPDEALARPGWCRPSRKPSSGAG